MTRALLPALCLLGCDILHDHQLQRPIPLSYDGTLLLSQGNGAGAGCDAALLGTPGPALVDVGTPLTAFRDDKSALIQHYTEGQVRLVAAGGKTQYLSCSQSVIGVTTTQPGWTLSWGTHKAGPLQLVLGGDLLRLYAVGLSFAKDRLQRT